MNRPIYTEQDSRHTSNIWATAAHIRYTLHEISMITMRFFTAHALGNYVLCIIMTLRSTTNTFCFRPHPIYKTALLLECWGRRAPYPLATSVGTLCHGVRCRLQRFCAHSRCEHSRYHHSCIFRGICYRFRDFSRSTFRKHQIVCFVMNTAPTMMSYYKCTKAIESSSRPCYSNKTHRATVFQCNCGQIMCLLLLFCRNRF